jgi:exosortase
MTASAWSRDDRVVLGLLLVAFAPAVVGLAEIWENVDHYSHGYLVPAVAGWAAWRERERLAGVLPRRDARGAVALAAALAVYLLALGVGSAELGGAAFVAAIAAGLWWRRGAATVRALAFPIGFLVFMVPVPAAWLAPLIVRLQVFVTRGAVAVLHAASVPVAREGAVIVLPGGESLFVAEACSGVTSIVTLLPLAVFLAYFTLRGAAARALLVAAVVPIAMLANLLRVIGTVLAAGRFGTAAATGGLVHEAAGLLTFVGGCLALIGVGACVARGLQGERRSDAPVRSEARARNENP